MTLQLIWYGYILLNVDDNDLLQQSKKEFIKATLDNQVFSIYNSQQQQKKPDVSD